MRLLTLMIWLVTLSAKRHFSLLYREDQQQSGTKIVLKLPLLGQTRGNNSKHDFLMDETNFGIE